MAGHRINIAVLTSSRADFSIYLPLLIALNKNKRFKVEIIAFGTHMSKKHGYSVADIKANGVKVTHKIPFKLKGDKPSDIAKNIGVVVEQFSSLWRRIAGKTDLIICLGDRYEMFAAVLASVPFNIPVAHIHGGEETLGAIDNIFRHSISQMSTLHFTSTARHAQRVKQLVPHNKHVYNVGALGIDSMLMVKKLSGKEFIKKFGFSLKNPVLATLHPETAGNISNLELVKAFTGAMKQIAKNSQVVVTLPNADAEGSLLRKYMLKNLKGVNSVRLVESLGVRGYYTALANCKMVIGNSSSGIIEAATFKKWVINIGDRQKGRTRSVNTVDCGLNEKIIMQYYSKLGRSEQFKGQNVYGTGGTSTAIINALVKYLA
ncbi:MAG: UDP-N-acetylglucosamine 2-epimerase [Flavobacteriales bacterium]